MRLCLAFGSFPPRQRQLICRVICRLVHPPALLHKPPTQTRQPLPSSILHLTSTSTLCPLFFGTITNSHCIPYQYRVLNTRLHYQTTQLPPKMVCPALSLAALSLVALAAASPITIKSRQTCHGKIPNIPSKSSCSEVRELLGTNNGKPMTSKMIPGVGTKWECFNVSLPFPCSSSLVTSFHRFLVQPSLENG
ncbi:hypothetical protein LY78DRAFT_122647 [Colletotrichum sublineola]|nr:hypothetical protein LY78DRAFT_122647 [Colletotrichum sublineola]